MKKYLIVFIISPMLMAQTITLSLKEFKAMMEQNNTKEIKVKVDCQNIEAIQFEELKDLGKELKDDSVGGGGGGPGKLDQLEMR